MRLSAPQVEAYHHDGFLFVERVFSAAEVAVLEAALPEITDPSRPETLVDETSGTVRMTHGSHLHSETFSRLARHPRLVRPTEQLLGGRVYVYQSRLNLKPALGRSAAPGYPWHQDFATWHERDGMPAPRAVVAFTFLDEVTGCNAPLMVIPRSHRQGILGQRRPPAPGASYRSRVLAPATLQALAAEHGMTLQTGPPGSALFMHCNLVHGSTENISPFRRALFSVVFSAVGNRAKRTAAPAHYLSMDDTPVEALPDDCLARVP